MEPRPTPRRPQGVDTVRHRAIRGPRPRRCRRVVVIARRRLLPPRRVVAIVLRRPHRVEAHRRRSAPVDRRPAFRPQARACRLPLLSGRYSC